MKDKSILSRIHSETGLELSRVLDQNNLSGIFNRFRPNGDGLDRIFEDKDTEGKVLSRLRRVFEVTASSWKAGDIYFVLRKFEPIDHYSAIKLVNGYLNGIVRLADFMGDSETHDTVKSLSIQWDSEDGFTLDEDIPSLIYECLTDFLAKMQPEQNEIFFLKEAFYSLANDYFLMAYLLWPAIQENVPLSNIMDSYFDIWFHGIKLNFSNDGTVFVKTPKYSI
jgi:hypothetical protein